MARTWLVNGTELVEGAACLPRHCADVGLRREFEHELPRAFNATKVSILKRGKGLILTLTLTPTLILTLTPTLSLTRRCSRRSGG